MKSKRRKRREPEAYRVVIKWTAATLLIAFGLILAFGAFGLTGVFGSAAFESARSLVGALAFLVPIIVIGIGVSLIIGRIPIEPLTGIGLVLLSLAVLTFLGITTKTWGGVAGAYAGLEATQFLGVAGALILLAA